MTASDYWSLWTLTAVTPRCTCQWMILPTTMMPMAVLVTITTSLAPCRLVDVHRPLHLHRHCLDVHQSGGLVDHRQGRFVTRGQRGGAIVSETMRAIVPRMMPSLMTVPMGWFWISV